MKHGVEVNEANVLLEKVARYLPDDAVAQVEQAYLYANECHQGQVRKSGEPYIVHPLQAAAFLADLNLDCHTICAALLHDVIEDCDVTYENIESAFDAEVAKLVDGVTKLTRMDYRLPGADLSSAAASDDPDQLYAESLRKMLVAMAEDIRVVLIKLADRLHNMKTLDALPLAKRKSIRPGNPGHLFPPGPPPGHLGNQVAAGRPGLSPPQRRPLPGNLPDAGRPPRRAGRVR